MRYIQGTTIAAFEETCIRVYVRLKKFLTDYQEYGNKRAIERLLNKQLLNDLIMKGLHGFSTLMCVDRACVNTIT